MTDKIDFNLHGAGFRPGKNDLVQRFVVQPNSADHTSKKISFVKPSRTFSRIGSGAMA